MTDGVLLLLAWMATERGKAVTMSSVAVVFFIILTVLVVVPAPVQPVVGPSSVGPPAKGCAFDPSSRTVNCTVVYNETTYRVTFVRFDALNASISVTIDNRTVLVPAFGSASIRLPNGTYPCQCGGPVTNVVVAGKDVTVPVRGPWLPPPGLPIGNDGPVFGLPSYSILVGSVAVGLFLIDGLMAYGIYVAWRARGPRRIRIPKRPRVSAVVRSTEPATSIQICSICRKTWLYSRGHAGESHHAALKEAIDFEAGVRMAYASTEGMNPFAGRVELHRLIRELVEARRAEDARALSEKRP